MDEQTAQLLLAFFTRRANFARFVKIQASFCDRKTASNYLDLSRELKISRMFQNRM
jgi:hypothetical protein